VGSVQVLVEQYMSSTGKRPLSPLRCGVAIVLVAGSWACSVYNAELLNSLRSAGGPGADAAGGSGGLGHGAASGVGVGSGGGGAPGDGGAGSSGVTTGSFAGAGGAVMKVDAGGSSGSGGAGNVIVEPPIEAGVSVVEASVDASEQDASVAEAGRDASHPVCALGECKLVFVSSSAVTANEGSAVQFDALCETFAEARGLAGEWKAWVSDGTLTVSMRMAHADVRYRLLDGSLVAYDWYDLTSGTLRHAINVREDGTASPPVEVWTGTSAVGEASVTCSNWTTIHGTAIVGQSDMVTYAWTYARQEYCDATSVHLYCFEQ
jgi:hypothetical protein